MKKLPAVGLKTEGLAVTEITHEADSMKPNEGSFVSSHSDVRGKKTEEKKMRLIYPMKLGKFDGSTEWEAFKEIFETAQRYNQWDEAEARDQLIATLQGDAARVLSENHAAKKTLQTLMSAVQD